MQLLRVYTGISKYHYRLHYMYLQGCPLPSWKRDSWPGQWKWAGRCLWAVSVRGPALSSLHTSSSSSTLWSAGLATPYPIGRRVWWGLLLRSCRHQAAHRPRRASEGNKATSIKHRQWTEVVHADAVQSSGLYTGFFPRGGKFLRTILHVHAQYTTREGYT